MLLFRALALSVLLSACGGLAETTPRSSGKDGGTAPPPAPVDAAAPSSAQILFEDSGVPPVPPPPVEAGTNRCEAAGGKCLELIACDGVLVDLSCGWSAACCMPTAPDDGGCPEPPPTEGSPCDLQPGLTCAYDICHVAECTETDGSAPEWVVGPGPMCSPPPHP